MKTCRQCATSIEDLHPRSVYCRQCAKARRREGNKRATQKYRTKNPEKRRELDATYRRAWRKRYRAKDRADKCAWTRNNVASRMLTRAKKRAKVSGRPFDLEKADIKVPEVCPLLGIPLYVGDGLLHSGSPSLDCIVPEKGYVRGNVWVISHRANKIKNDATAFELFAIARGLEKKLAES